ncbi:MAG: hypothetical protein AAF572_27095 [Cyanobacteria bacterium P01_B01_bin.77]
MKLEHISFDSLNAKQKEFYNFQKVASILADYGFNCIWLSDDWNGADFLADHISGEKTLRVQLKARMAVDKKYLCKNITMAFPVNGNWYLIDHDLLVELIRKYTKRLQSSSWEHQGSLHSNKPSKVLIDAMSEFIIESN